MAATIEVAREIFTLLNDDTAKTYELHQLCVWGADTTCDGGCACAIMIRVSSATASTSAFILEPGATESEFWAAQELLASTELGFLVVGRELYANALGQC